MQVRTPRRRHDLERRRLPLDRAAHLGQPACDDRRAVVRRRRRAGPGSSSGRARSTGRGRAQVDVGAPPIGSRPAELHEQLRPRAAAAAGASSSSTPRSNRRDASRRQLVAARGAARSTTGVEVRRLEHDVGRAARRSRSLAPPMTPASAIGPLSSVMTRSSVSSARSTSSRVRSRSPGAARRTTIGAVRAGRGRTRAAAGRARASRGW